MFRNKHTFNIWLKVAIFMILGEQFIYFLSYENFQDPEKFGKEIPHFRDSHSGPGLGTLRSDLSFSIPVSLAFQKGT